MRLHSRAAVASCAKQRMNVCIATRAAHLATDSCMRQPGSAAACTCVSSRAGAEGASASPLLLPTASVRLAGG